MYTPFRSYSYELKNLTDDDWTYIHENRGNFLELDEFELVQALRYPGFILDKNSFRCEFFDQINNYKEWWARHFQDTSLVSPRGNLASTKYRFKSGQNEWPVVVCGIAPGYSTLSRNEPKWLLGPSSKVLHIVLASLGIYPYFTNIYKEAMVNNNTSSVDRSIIKSSIRMLIKELKLLDAIWNCPVIYVITLGNYKEYSLLHEILPSKFKIVKSWHPSYLVRNGVPISGKELLKKNILNLRKELIYIK